MKEKHTPKAIPERREVLKEHSWDLSKLFPSPEAWEEGLTQLKEDLGKIASFKGRLGKSAEDLKECQDFMSELGRLEERLGYYAQLKLSEDGGNSEHQSRFARFMQAASEAEALASYQVPEIQAIPDETMEKFLAAPLLSDYVISLKKILRFKPHVLSEGEERILALQAEVNQVPNRVFSSLTDVDLDFGTVEDEKGEEKPLSHSSFSSFLLNPNKEVRARAYHQYYQVFEKHKNTISALYSGSVQLDIYKAKVRNYPSARAMALFPDKVPESVYDNLIQTVRDNVDTLHRYYDVRKKALGLSELHHYDVYVPLVKDLKVHHSYEEAVEKVIAGLAPLGEEYRETLKNGLLGRWVDRYENRGKRSGAFSAGSYDGDPYILMNYKSDVLRDVFTLAHEGGHSMHSYYSVQNNPFQHYSYTIFEAEVASTFNEQLLADYLMKNTSDQAMKLYLIGKQADDIIATIFRQTMFAEFEHNTHKMVEGGKPLTVESMRKTYRALLEAYFGSGVKLVELSDLEGFRIPHFYRAFYVYKYATGLSAAIALSKQVLDGSEKERERFLAFLGSGGSKYPIESLRLAGVDMSSPQPIQEAMALFGSLVDELEKGLKTED